MAPAIAAPLAACPAAAIGPAMAIRAAAAIDLNDPRIRFLDRRDRHSGARRARQAQAHRRAENDPTHHLLIPPKAQKSPECATNGITGQGEGNMTRSLQPPAAPIENGREARLARLARRSVRPAAAVFRAEMIAGRAGAAVEHRMASAMRAPPHARTTAFGDASDARLALERGDRNARIGRGRDAHRQKRGENNSGHIFSVPV